MITSQASHDYALVHQLSNVVSTQPVGTHTHESSVTSRICNIPTNIFHYSSKGTKVAGKYTCETITAHPIIAAYTLIAIEIVVLVLAACRYKAGTNREGSHPIISELTFIAALVAILIATVIGLALASYRYTLRTNREANR